MEIAWQKVIIVRARYQEGMQAALSGLIYGATVSDGRFVLTLVYLTGK